MDTYELWILEDMKRDHWRCIVIQTPQSIIDQLSHFSNLLFHGFTRAEEFLFSEIERRVFYLHCHNPATLLTRKDLIQQSSASAYTLRRNSFCNHLKTLMFT
ncbi:unnamed protein product [Brassica napus]|uniref:(rape) hypothetical protein n=1 Tax=Brassica napus TaxID=3708 RepID=A0A816IG26_BRANA|nr:unnamed protein product [Brassica napus]